MNNYFIIDETPSNPMVSVAMLAYNHEKFIVEAIESVLMQQVDFSFKIIIAEDCSTDNTRAILLDYQKKYPVIIKLILQNNNVGAKKNNEVLLSNLEGKYIAALEGDDYWTDPLKLQKQVDFLESNPEYYSCFSAYDIIRFDTDTIRYKIEVPQKHNLVEKDGFTFGLLDFQKYFIPRTLTGVFRKAIFEEINFYKYKHFRDLHLFYHLLKEHKAFYFNKSMGVYRVHPGGINSMKEGLNNNLAAYNCYKELYEINNDNFCRVKYFQSIHALLKFSIYNDFDGNTIIYKFDLYLKMIKLLRNFKEIKLLLSVFVLRMNFINK